MMVMMVMMMMMTIGFEFRPEKYSSSIKLRALTFGPVTAVLS